MMNKNSELQAVQHLLREFVIERNWGQFHTPKNLATALSVEASELLEPFQWLQTGSVEELSPEKLAAIRYEMADVLAYLLLLADKLKIDLIESIKEKIESNKLKYPVEQVFGNARKYSDHEG